jgi:hypothetical protein
MSCAPVSYFYQLQKIESEDVSQNDHAKIVSEFDDVDIIANFWADGGNTSFMIYNKTDSNILVLYKSEWVNLHKKTKKSREKYAYPKGFICKSINGREALVHS